MNECYARMSCPASRVCVCLCACGVLLFAVVISFLIGRWCTDRQDVCLCHLLDISQRVHFLRPQPHRQYTYVEQWRYRQHQNTYSLMIHSNLPSTLDMYININGYNSILRPYKYRHVYVLSSTLYSQIYTQHSR